MSKNKKIIAALTLIFTAFMIMTFASMPTAGSKEMTISDIFNDRENFEGEYLMTEGLLIKDSIEWDAEAIELRFEIYDANETILPVRYQGVQPDNFTEDVIVIVEGFMNKDGLFEAEKVLTKCPSKYEGEDIEDYDSEMHKELYSNESED